MIGSWQAWAVSAGWLRYQLMVWFRRPYKYTTGFANYSRFIEHFDNRRSRFNLNTWYEFAVWADKFCGGPRDTDTDECIRLFDGATLRYNNVTGLLGILRSDDIIKTCFPPSRGRQYYDDECNRIA